MTDQEIKALIENTRKKHKNLNPKKVKFTMEFGEFTIQYDFSLN